MKRSCLRLEKRSSRGVALIILMTIVALGVMTFLTMQLESIGTFQRTAQNDSSSGNAALKQARDALLGYAVTYRDSHAGEVFGYLPCPDRDGDGDADPNSDGYCATNDGKAEIGLLPYKTLGLPDLRDADGNCLWYAVAGNFKAVSGTKATMNWDTQGQFSILGSDSSARTPAPDISGGEGGAAAIVFAAGAPIGSQSRTPTGSNPCRVNMRSVNPDSSQNPNPTSVSNYLDGNYNFAVTTTVPVTQGIVTDSAGNVTNNDLLVWITPKQIFDRIKRRSDFTAAINTLSSSLATSLSPAVPGAALPAHDAGDATTVGSKLTGKFPASTSVPSAPTDYTGYRNNWRDMYRYVRCTPSSPSNKCLTINGQSCMGTLIFAGQHTTSGPRTSANKGDAATYIDGGGNYSAFTTAGANTFTGAATFAMADPSQLATQDVLYCLNSLDLTSITGTSGFAVAASSPLVSSFASSGQLGSTTATGSDRSACTWSPTAVDFLNGLSVYFKMTITTRDDGLTFVVADASTNPSTTNLCGGIGSNGQYLGYAGTHSSGNSIKPPKIGLELDMRRDNSLTSDTDYAAWQSYVPAFTLNRHAAFVYWGDTVTNSDDNTHGAGTLGSATKPLNPKTATGIASATFANPSVYHVRLDIQRTYAAPVGTYVMKAYVLLNNFSDFVCQPFLTDLNDDASNHCTASISNTITINDSLTSGSEAMKKIYLGFTTSQRATRTQNITIGNFAAQNH